MKTILITNAQIVNEGRVQTGDIYIAKGRIEQIDSNLSSRQANIVIDADGRYVLPGMIDDQVHFREPGMPHKGNIYSESRAAVAGGITSFMDMPNTLPPTTTCDRMEEKYARAAGRSFANFAFYLGGANDNIEEIRALEPAATCGVKVFMGASTGNMLVDDPKTLKNIFADSPTLVATHCEDTPTIMANEKKARSKFGEDIPMRAHPHIRSEDACFISSTLAVDLALKNDTQLHLLHLTTAKEMSLLTSGPTQNKQITAEVCIHHLFFDDASYNEKGTLIKCNPAIKSPQDRTALIEAVLQNRIDIIATDHAPHTLKEKQNSYLNAPSGLPLVQDALVCLLEHVHDGTFTLPLIVEKTAHAPARLFRLKDRGFLREGYWADLTLVDLNHPHQVGEFPILAHCGWSPFLGYTFQSSVVATIVSGHLAYHQNRVDPQPAGMRLEIDR